MNQDRKGIAIFDFDGTIIRKDSFLEFIRFTHGSVMLYYSFLYHGFYLLLYFLTLYPNHRLKEKFFGFFYKGFEEDRLKKMGVDFSQKKIILFYHKYAEETLQWHRDRGHDVLILTASSSIWVGGWCNQKGYDLIDTVFEVNDGIYTGKIAGKNCYGKEKFNRIENLIKRYDTFQTYGYGDNRSDLHFLKLTHNIHFRSLAHKPQHME